MECLGALQVLTCTVTGTINGGQSGNIVVSGVAAHYAATSQTVAGSISYADASSMATGTGGTVTDTQAAPLSAVSIAANQNLNEALVQYTVKLTTGIAIPNLGKIAIVFPAGVDLTGVSGTTAGTLIGLDGTWTAAVSGQTVTYTQTEGGETAGGALSFVVTGAKNPTALGTTADATVETEDVDGLVTQSGLAVGYPVVGISHSTEAPEVAAGPGATAPAPVTTTTPPVPAANVQQPAPVVPLAPTAPPVSVPIGVSPEDMVQAVVPLFTKTLRVGSRGADVEALQTVLELREFLKMPSGVAKGYFGGATQTALKKYQKVLKVRQTGILDAATRAAIK
jgi:hypothetical protein